MTYIAFHIIVIANCKVVSIASGQLARKLLTKQTKQNVSIRMMGSSNTTTALGAVDNYLSHDPSRNSFRMGVNTYPFSRHPPTTHVLMV